MQIARILMVVMAAALMFEATDADAKNDVYRWVDKDGLVHFGDKPPEHTNTETVDLSQSDSMGVKPPSNSTAAGGQDETEPSLAEQRREARAETRNEARERQEAIDAGCKQRHEIVAQLEPSTRVMVMGEDGEVYRLDDNERLKALDEAKSYIAEKCND